MRTVVGVLRGGPTEYDVSLKSGAAVLEHIDREKYDPRDIFIDKQGVWHMHGMAVEPARALYGLDVAFNSTHGRFGEDGGLQRLLESHAIPYVGSSAFVTGVAHNRHLYKEAAKRRGIRVAHSLVIEREDIDPLAHRLFRSFPHPARVASVYGRGSMVADTFDALHASLGAVLRDQERAILEEHIAGRSAGVGIIRGFRGEPVYALLPTPLDLSVAQKGELAALAKQAHEALELGHYSHLEFVVSRRGNYLVGVSTHPPLHTESPFFAGLQAVGASLKEFLTHGITMAKHR